MSTLTKLDMPRVGDGCRWTVGLLVSSKCTHASAALVAATGRGLDLQPHLAGMVTAEIPRATASMFGPLADRRMSPLGSPHGSAGGSLAVLRNRLAEFQALLLDELLAGLGVSPTRVVAVGVHDPGIWNLGRQGAREQLGLCDAAALAEGTGLNVIDAFPARDLARGGQGGPLAALPEWILLRQPKCNRLLLDLGRTVRMTYLPSTFSRSPSARIVSFDVGPGTRLLDVLAHKLTGGEHRHDPGGRLAVQGRRIPQLLEHWQADPYFERPLPRWHPHGVQPERFLTDAMQMAVDNGWSVRDLLCSATHFIAETVSSAMSKRLPEDADVGEIVITGGGQHNGLLLREIGRLTELPLTRIDATGVPSEALGPASIGLLAMLYIDQVPANQPAITGAEVSRLLGRLTPGSPQNWQRLLQVAAGSSPAVRPLRSAM